MSGANMAHRLHGKKRMDSIEANRFTERLGLPAGWLDTPRSEDEIPDSVSRLLAPASRGRASVEQHEQLTATTNDGVPGKPAAAKAKGRARASALSEPESPSPVSADAAGEKETLVVSPLDHVSDLSDGVAGRSPEERDVEAPAATPATLESSPASAIAQRGPGTAPLHFREQPGQPARYRTDRGSIDQDAGR